MKWARGLLLLLSFGASSAGLSPDEILSNRAEAVPGRSRVIALYGRQNPRSTIPFTARARSAHSRPRAPDRGDSDAKSSNSSPRAIDFVLRGLAFPAYACCGLPAHHPAVVPLSCLRGAPAHSVGAEPVPLRRRELRSATYQSLNARADLLIDPSINPPFDTFVPPTSTSLCALGRDGSRLIAAGRLSSADPCCSPAAALIARPVPGLLCARGGGLSRSAPTTASAVEVIRWCRAKLPLLAHVMPMWVTRYAGARHHRVSLATLPRAETCWGNHARCDLMYRARGNARNPGG